MFQHGIEVLGLDEPEGLVGDVPGDAVNVLLDVAVGIGGCDGDAHGVMERWSQPVGRVGVRDGECLFRDCSRPGPQRR